MKNTFRQLEKEELQRYQVPEQSSIIIQPSSSCRLEINEIGAAPFDSLLRKSRKNTEIQVFSITVRDIEKALALNEFIDPATKLPAEYHDFLDVFSKKDSDRSPEYRSYDYIISLVEGKTSSFGVLYSISQDKLKVLRKYLDEHLSKGVIRVSSSPTASLVLFVKKLGGGLRFYIDYRKLNSITIKNRYSLPLIKEILDRLYHTKVYSKIDIITAFNRMRITKGEEWKTAFRTRYSLYKYLVIPFGLANTPSSFQYYINDALRDYLDVFCIVYIDDILIYSRSKKEYTQYIRQVLQRLREVGLQADIAKCEFYVTKVTYLGLIITTKGIRIDLAKIRTIVDQEAPTYIKDIQVFVGFTNFYRRFIKEFLKVVAPLTYIAKKDISFQWKEAQQEVFKELKRRFVSTLILTYFDYGKQSIVETDTSNNITAGIIS